ncbi:MAG: hypothetical protein LH472_16790 [Pyrinomonadaceae bacterium]|nr:hypothetical protein [Pyrinomonadaceae bacterium]
MDANERRRYEMFIRVRQFSTDNAADFPAGRGGATQFAVVAAVVGELDVFAADQSAGSGGSRQDTVTKDTARENLREAMMEITRTARSMEYQFDGIDAKFRLPRSKSDQNVLAAARAFYDGAAAYDADFQTYGLGKNFRADLQTDITDFENSIAPGGSMIDQQVAGTAEIGEAVGRGMIARRILEGVVKNKYNANVGKLAAWLSASHIEKAPKPKPPTP